MEGVMEVMAEYSKLSIFSQLWKLGIIICGLRLVTVYWTMFYGLQTVGRIGYFVDDADQILVLRYIDLRTVFQYNWTMVLDYDYGVGAQEIVMDIDWLWTMFVVYLQTLELDYENVLLVLTEFWNAFVFHMLDIYLNLMIMFFRKIYMYVGYEGREYFHDGG